MTSEDEPLAEPTAGPSTSGPTEAERRAAAWAAGEHRVSVPGALPDRPPAGAGHGRVAQRPAMDFWEVLYERRTTRRFDRARPVPREIVLELLDAALIAPTSCNLQMWDFVVVDDPEQRMKLGALSLQVLATPVTIFVAYGKQYSEEGHANVQSAAAAMMTMSLAAHALGIGTFWINQLGPRDQVGAILGLPPDREVVAALAVGWPQTYPTRAPRRRPFEHVVHWNHVGGRPTPSSPRPEEWTLPLIRDYQQARVLNGNRYNKGRPWELAFALSCAARMAPVDRASTPGDGAPRWLDVLPVHGMMTAAMSREHRDHRWAVLELSADVARFAAKRCPAQVRCEALVYDPEDPAALPAGAFDVVTVLHRLESLPPDTRGPLLAALARALAPHGRLLLAYTSARSFQGLASWLRARRGGPGGVEYVMAPDPNLGPYAPLRPGDVEALARAAGLVVRERDALDVVPTRAEADFRTRNLGAAGAAPLRAAVALGRAIGRVPGVAGLIGRTRVLVLARR